jgi:hypothetical protein
MDYMEFIKLIIRNNEVVNKMLIGEKYIYINGFIYSFYKFIRY